MDKTNAMRVLDRTKTKYEYFIHELPQAVNGVEMAKMIDKDVKVVFKTLVTVSKSNLNYVFMVPVAEELDLKKCATAVGEKSIEMIPQKQLLPLTGYVHGGCSPIGMKKQFKTVCDITALSYDTIYFSAGKIGYQVGVNPKDLEKIIPLTFFDIKK